MIDLNKIYPLFFNQGASGTFLVYLINLHNGFNTVELYKCYSKMTAKDQVLDELTAKTNNTVYHVMLGSPSWTWTQSEKNSTPEIVPFGVDNWKKKAERKVGNKWTEKKLAIKMQPHDLIYEYAWLVEIEKYLTNMNPIVIKLGSREFYNNWILKRYKQNSEYSYITTDSYDSMITRMNTITDEFNKLNIDHYVVNLENILNLDDNEYNKLIDYLETDSLSNWKDVVTDYKKLIGID